MRIIKELTIEDINVSIFKMEQKYTLKLEWNRMEQTFKLDGRDGVEELDHVLALIDKSFIEKVRIAFKTMASNRNDRLSALQEITEEDFPEII